MIPPTTEPCRGRRAGDGAPADARKRPLRAPEAPQGPEGRQGPAGAAQGPPGPGEPGEAKRGERRRRTVRPGARRRGERSEPATPDRRRPEAGAPAPPMQRRRSLAEGRDRNHAEGDEEAARPAMAEPRRAVPCAAPYARPTTGPRQRGERSRAKQGRRRPAVPPVPRRRSGAGRDNTARPGAARR